MDQAGMQGSKMTGVSQCPRQRQTRGFQTRATSLFVRLVSSRLVSPGEGSDWEIADCEKGVAGVSHAGLHHAQPRETSRSPPWRQLVGPPPCCGSLLAFASPSTHLEKAFSSLLSHPLFRLFSALFTLVDPSPEYSIVDYSFRSF